MPPLRILYAEDVEADAALVELYLRREGYQPVIQRVETALEMGAALEAHSWDLVLSDYALPGFGALAALSLLQASQVDLPFIVISGVIREDEAVTALKAGAHDFVVKSNLARLAPAIARELRDAADRQQKRAAQAALAQERSLLRTLIDNIPDMIYAKDRASRFILANLASARSLGRAPRDVVGRTDFELHPPELAAQFFADEQAAMRADQPLIDHEETVFVDGQQRWLLTTTVPVHDSAGQVIGMVGISRDITDRKQGETALAQQHDLLRMLIDNLPDAIYVKDTQSRNLLANLTDASRMGATPAETIGKTDFDFYPRELAEQYFADDQAVIVSGQAIINREEPITEATGRLGWVLTTKLPLRDQQGHVIGLVGIGRDITERKRAEQALLQSQADLETAQAQVHLGSWTRDAASDVTHWSKEMFRLHYLPLADQPPSFHDYIETINPADRATATEQINAVAQDAERAACFYRTHPALGPERILELKLQKARDSAGQLLGWHGTVQDVTELQQHLLELESINRISATLRQAKTVDEMLPELLSGAVATLHGSAGSLWLFDAASDLVQLVLEQGWGRHVPPFKRGEGVPGYVVATGQPYFSRELKTDPRMAESVRAFVPAGRGGICVPIRYASSIIGVLYINIDLPNEFSDNDVRLLSTLAEIAGSTYHRLKLHEETEHRLSQLAALRAIDQAISSNLDLRLTLEIILDQVTSQLQVDAASVLLFSEYEARLRFAAGRGFRTLAIANTRLRLGEGAAGLAGLERRIVQVADIRDSRSGFLRASLLASEEFIGYAAVPLLAKGKLQGILETFHRAPLVTDKDWLNFLEALAGQAAIALDNAALFTSLQRSNTELQVAYDATIEGWSLALDLRDKETEGHSRRVTDLTERLALNMGLSEAELVHVRRGALLHDIGKMGVPDHILLKSSPLTDEEWAQMRQHPDLAHRMLSPIAYLGPALDIPYCHHEKWDGSGYPRGLVGEQIPLAARIFAIVDVWDALRSDRPYRPAWPAAKVREHIRQLSGTHFDPQVVEAFLDMNLASR